MKSLQDLVEEKNEELRRFQEEESGRNESLLDCMSSEFVNNSVKEQMMILKQEAETHLLTIARLEREKTDAAKLHEVEIKTFERKIERMRESVGRALWSGTKKNRDISTGPLARPFPCSLALLTHSLAPDCLLRSRPPLSSLARSLTLLTPSLLGK